jgi:hypothetical protein
VSDNEFRFPEHDHPSDFELWLEHDGMIRMRSGVKIVELTAPEARDLGHALIELAEAAERE